MTNADVLLTFVLRLADNALILGQRMIERVTGEPELEEELANANFALDYIGQARMLYTYAGELEGKGRSEDDFAYLRDSQEFSNLLLLEQPNGDFGDAIVRQFLFEAFYLRQLEALENCADVRLAEIAARAVKEIRYHLRHASNWMLRLGDGTDESHARVQSALDNLWRYTGEMFTGDDVDVRFAQEFDGPDLDAIASAWQQHVTEVLGEATLTIPEVAALAARGRDGQHSEYLGYLIAEMQHLQRAYPGASW
ncbi:MAG: phenylacetate-CoA oxygenase subunit PaaC [Gammaproteobacteria bacterium]|nr:phenylacetate-CoA oxygenase subunit PaaC [Gammaproteobacteria bacterium]